MSDTTPAHQKNYCAFVHEVRGCICEEGTEPAEDKHPFHAALVQNKKKQILLETFGNSAYEDRFNFTPRPTVALRASSGWGNPSVLRCGW